MSLLPVEKLPEKETGDIATEDGVLSFTVQPQINSKTVIEKINELIELVNEQSKLISTILKWKYIPPEDKKDDEPETMFFPGSTISLK